MHKCRGTCVGKEPRALHDARLQLALASLRIKPWPFAGAIGIREPEPGTRSTCLHVIDRWQHLGTARGPDEVTELLRTSREQHFDADSYRIIGRCLANLRPQDLVMLGPASLA